MLFRFIFGSFDRDGAFDIKKTTEKEIEKNYREIRDYIFKEGADFQFHDHENFFITNKDPTKIKEEEMRQLQKLKFDFYPGVNQKIVIILKDPTLFFNIDDFLKKHNLEFTRTYNSEYVLKNVGIYKGSEACIVLNHYAADNYEISVDICKEHPYPYQIIEEMIQKSKDEDKIITAVNKAIGMITGVEQRSDISDHEIPPIMKFILDIESIIKNTDDKNEMLKKMHMVRNAYGELRFAAMYQNASPTTSRTMQLLNERVSAILNKM